MDTILPEEKQSLLANLASEYFEEVPEIADFNDLQLEILDLENKLGGLCAIPSLKIRVIQNAQSHQDEFARLGSQASNVDENLQTAEETSTENLLIRSKKQEKKRKAEFIKLGKDLLELEDVMHHIRALGPAQFPTEPRDATRKHQLQKENVRLANILTIMSASRHLDSRRQKKIEELCEMVHTKNYNLEVPDHDV